MGRIHIPIEKDGFVKASHVANWLEKMADTISERFSEAEADIENLESQNARLTSAVKRLEAEIETERRLRLAMSRNRGKQ